jgi:hypothetical protein
MTTNTVQRVDAGRLDNPVLLRLGASAMVLGLLGQLPLGAFHPHEAYANNSAAAFHEYSHSQDWVLVHLGQFLGALLVALGLVAIATSLARPGGWAGALGVVAAVTAVTSVAVFAVQMAVDGVALKAAVDAWVSAPSGVEQDVAYRVAESIRSVEKGLSALFNLTNGLTLLSLGLGLGMGRSHPRWLGWTGAAAGLGLLTVGMVTAQTGFSREAASLVLPTTAVLTVFVVGMAVAMWRRADR